VIPPRALRPGARVHLVAPAGPLPEGGIERAVERVVALGWEPVLGRHAAGLWRYLAGTDEERLADLQEAIDDPEGDAIWCLRGGYGTMRLLPRLDLAPLRLRPRPLVGYSDNTALHLAAARHGVISFHGPHPAAAEVDPFSLELLRHLLSEPDPMGTLPLPPGFPAPGPGLVPGIAEGPLVGGNLSLLAATVGTPYQLRARGAILFLEEVGEPAYRIDRLLSQLLLSGALEGVAGIAVGAISDCPDDGSPEIPTPDEVVLDRLGSLGVPLACGLPFGHVPRSWTLPVGVRARLDADCGELTLLGPAVSGGRNT